MWCCFEGATSMNRMGPVPVTVMVRICEGSGTGSQPVSGTSSGTVYPSHQAVAERAERVLFTVAGLPMLLKGEPL